MAAGPDVPGGRHHDSHQRTAGPKANAICVEELLAERGVTVDHVTIYRWVQRFAPEFIEAARPCGHAPGDRWFVDETYLKVAGKRTYLYRVIDELVPSALHIVEQYANSPVESDHGRLKARLRPMRGLKRQRSARILAAGHAFVQNLRRGHYDIATDVPDRHRLRKAFDDLAIAL